MAASISILGNTGSNAELRYSEQGLPIASFSMASNSFRNTQGERVQVTEWFSVTAFGKVAETLAAHVKKGTQLLVLGRLTFQPWLTNDGEPRAGAEVILQSFEFAGANRNGDAGVEAVAEEVHNTGPVDAQSMSDGATSSTQTAARNEPFDGQF